MLFCDFFKATGISEASITTFVGGGGRGEWRGELNDIRKKRKSYIEVRGIPTIWHWSDTQTYSCS